MKDQRIYCRDILERTERIERYTIDGRETFLRSKLLQDGVIRSFEVIREAVKHLAPELINQYPAVIWSDFAGFRDVLIHQYHKIRIDLVWDFAQEDLPPLKAATQAMLIQLESQHTDE